jgi:hypothetical protein
MIKLVGKYWGQEIDIFRGNMGIPQEEYLTIASRSVEETQPWYSKSIMLPKDADHFESFKILTDYPDQFTQFDFFHLQTRDEKSYSYYDKWDKVLSYGMTDRQWYKMPATLHQHTYNGIECYNKEKGDKKKGKCYYINETKNRRNQCENWGLDEESCATAVGCKWHHGHCRFALGNCEEYQYQCINRCIELYGGSSLLTANTPPYVSTKSQPTLNVNTHNCARACASVENRKIVDMAVKYCGMNRGAEEACRADCRNDEACKYGCGYWREQETITASKVRVTLSGKNYLHLAQVRVFDLSGSNLAFNKPATQSTTDSPASNAVDGNIVDSHFSSTQSVQGEKCSHS